ncbi:MAG: (E)-4-hydroxy-3-methylbut-2-enyl-diphosphate synthase [Elusimicrobia bacterium]|nr:(E)-4-hydroxy-3-methylbut-2-enyl-diphosphate synthase [Elusimicrobiota bacterium]
MPLPPYCPDPFSYKRRLTRAVAVGKVLLGANNPLRLQSMTTTDTLDVVASVAQTARLAQAGCEIVRLTAPTVEAARALEGIKTGLIQKGVDIPLVADIHFQPEAAMTAADFVEKIRINPGNFPQDRFPPLVDKLKSLKRSLRIGVNHGSLSERIKSRYGDTPQGMVESALEFARLCEKQDFHEVVFSMKASNVKVMIAAYRLLAARMAQAGMDYPFHLGVTEAGEGEDGRIKSAIGIGSLLEDGIGDTIRVSLTEEPEAEIPVCGALAARFRNRKPAKSSAKGRYCDPYSYTRRTSRKTTIAGFAVGGETDVRVVSQPVKAEEMELNSSALRQTPEFVEAETADKALSLAQRKGAPLVGLVGKDPSLLLREYRLLAAEATGLAIHIRAPRAADDQRQILEASTLIGALLCDGIGDTVEIDTGWRPARELSLAYNILQAAGVRLSKTEFVSCPGCGRTLYDLQAATASVKRQLGHLKGLKIAVMGCIVNGPGEMADADFGYVGGAPGRINLYVGKRCVRKGVPERLAVQALKDLIKQNGKWRD